MATAIAMATSLTRLGCVEVRALKMRMPMALRRRGRPHRCLGCMRGLQWNSGEIFECGCADIPEGDCDCNGNQLDAIGVCAGDCPADLNNNGICDSEEECAGFEDECNVCFGPGAIYECGCFDIRRRLRL